MKKVVIFGRDNCEFCVKAKEHLDERGVDYEYVTLKTVPAIVVDGEFIGGFTELKERVE